MFCNRYRHLGYRNNTRYKIITFIILPSDPRKPRSGDSYIQISWRFVVPDGYIEISRGSVYDKYSSGDLIIT